ncbi:MAG TPA: DAK2 domain-containing protein [Candidatus Limnocylindrales bacterium]
MTRRAGDGTSLLAAFRAAVDNLAAHVDEVDALNVYPVPDGDTGSNMLATVKAALAEAEAVADPSADRVAQAVSYGALMGARGNSGVIASQIFRGMAEGLGGKRHFTGLDLAHALSQGSATAYKAVGKPVEGTILTVIRESAAAAVVAAEADGDLEDVLTAAVSGAQRAVAKTPTLLPILREAGVVDAGGEGLYRLLQGTLQYMVSHTPASLPAGAPAGARPSTLVVRADEGFGYETMFMLQDPGGPIDVDLLRTELEKIGQSVLVAGDSKAVKVHVHNERPDQVIALGLSMGNLTKISVENLDAQSQDVQERRASEIVEGRGESRPAGHADTTARVGGHAGAQPEVRPHVALETFGGDVAVAPASGSGGNGSGGTSVRAAKVPLAVVAVTSGEGLARIFDSFGVAAVVRGGQSDNPSTGELLDAVEKIAADEILLLPNNPNVVLAARQATEMTSLRVRVVPTRNAAEGFAALLALDPYRDATVNAEVMTLASRVVQTFQVTAAVRDATIGGRKVRKGQTIVLDPDDGLLAVNNDRTKAVLTALGALQPGFELLTIYYGDGADLAEAEALSRRLREWRAGVEVEVLHGGQPHYRYLIAAE